MKIKPRTCRSSFLSICLAFKSFISILLVSIFLWIPDVFSEDVTIGFVSTARDFSISSSSISSSNNSDSKSPASQLIQAALSEGLVRIKSHPLGERELTPDTGIGTAESEWELALSDKIQVSSDHLNWSFRLRDDAIFHNLAPIEEVDMVASVTRCKKESVLMGITEIESRSEPQFGGRDRSWINIKLDPSYWSSEKIKSFPRFLSSCPILPERLISLFGQDWGSGSNFVGSGPYRINNVNPGKVITLEKFDRYRKRNGGVETIELRNFEDPSHGLTSLRVGNILALFTTDPQVLEIAKGDETLLVDNCSLSSVILRKELTFFCKGGIDLTNLHYGS